MIDFENDLNEGQLAAVQAADGPLLVLAAAGTGKTRTLVYRTAYLVERGVPPWRILLLTFTNKAAREMLERAQSLVGPDAGGVWGGTFHHMANRLLRRHASLVGHKSDYTILDRDDSRTLVANSIKARKLANREFPKPAVLLSLFSASANTEVPLSGMVEERFPDLAVDHDAVVQVHKDYEAKKRELDAMDFDDMLVKCLRLLQENESVRQRYQEQFQHILVDEYQDTNTIQSQMVDTLAEASGNLFVVGDDFQSIYSWRGADYRNIMSFGRRHEGAGVRKLETNYRSVPEILAVANACIAGNPEQYQKVLRPTREAYEKPVVAHLRDGETQAGYVVEQIRALRRSGYKASDIAVLYRAHYHAMELQMAMTREHVDYMITSGMRFFEQAHIKDVCSLLRILENPEDELAFARLLGFLPGIGPRRAEKVWQALGGRFDASEPGPREIVTRALSPQARALWAPVDKVLAAYREEGLGTDGGEALHRFVEAFYQEHAANTYDNWRERLDDVRELILYTARFETVEQFLSDVALLSNLDSEVDSHRGAETSESVRLSTVHQAKGLEWAAVIVLWMTDGMFPSARAVNESPAGLAEERRLFYVAVTRAKDELTLCVPEVRRTRDGGVYYCEPSPFIDEIPPDLVRESRVSFL